MSVWDSLVGQKPVIDMLSRIAQGDPSQITQSWLICGPPGSGRSNMARAFAAALESPDHGMSAEPTRVTQQVDGYRRQGLRPSPVAFIKPGNLMTVPDAWNTASPSVGPAGADKRTVAVEPVASAIWQASVRCQISVYRRSWSPGSLEASSSGSWKREPAGRIHSWASCAPAVLVAYCLGSAEDVYKRQAWSRSATRRRNRQAAGPAPRRLTVSSTRCRTAPCRPNRTRTRAWP